MAKKRLNFIDRLFLWVNIAFSLGLLISYLAPVVDPAKFWPVAFFGLAYPILLLGNAILIVWWLIRKSKWMLLPVICILVGWKTLNRNIGLRFPSDPPYIAGSDMIRVMTYNVHDFKRYGARNDIPTKREILQIIREQQPDIIGFQEFYTRRRGQYDMLDSILKILNTNYYYLEAVDSTPYEDVGLALFSKYPITAHGYIQISDPTNENQCIYVDVQKGKKQFRVYSVHLQSINFDPEDYRYVTDMKQDGKPVGSAKRLGSKLKKAFIKRSEQVFKIRESANACPYPYIISGDFNDTPTSYALNQMSKGLKNAFVEKGSGLGRTYNGSFPNFQIDYILATPQFGISSYKIIEKRLSDHYPVRSDLMLK
ncbi:MAG TPA: endonuclease/exonuclease/phosphatase family protein [Mucilaginibacter sp.]|nr:endonuclease/exonuclease/phosphatase family protein [Mucilaginibacter sp.]